MIRDGSSRHSHHQYNEIYVKTTFNKPFWHIRYLYCIATQKNRDFYRMDSQVMQFNYKQYYIGLIHLRHYLWKKWNQNICANVDCNSKMLNFCFYNTISNVEKTPIQTYLNFLSISWCSILMCICICEYVELNIRNI